MVVVSAVLHKGDPVGDFRFTFSAQIISGNYGGHAFEVPCEKLGYALLCSLLANNSCACQVRILVADL